MLASDPAHTEFVAEQIAKIVMYVLFAAVGLYFFFKPRKPPKQ